MFTSESLSLFRGIVSKFQYWLIFHAEKYLTFLHIIFKCIVTAVNLKNLHFFTKNLLNSFQIFAYCLSRPKCLQNCQQEPHDTYMY